MVGEALEDGHLVDWLGDVRDVRCDAQAHAGEHGWLGGSHSPHYFLILFYFKKIIIFSVLFIYIFNIFILFYCNGHVSISLLGMT